MTNIIQLPNVKTNATPESNVSKLSTSDTKGGTSDSPIAFAAVLSTAQGQKIRLPQIEPPAEEPELDDRTITQVEKFDLEENDLHFRTVDLKAIDEHLPKQSNEHIDPKPYETAIADENVFKNAVTDKAVNQIEQVQNSATKHVSQTNNSKEKPTLPILHGSSLQHVNTSTARQQSDVTADDQKSEKASMPTPSTVNGTDEIKRPLDSSRSSPRQFNNQIVTTHNSMTKGAETIELKLFEPQKVEATKAPPTLGATTQRPTPLQQPQILQSEPATGQTNAAPNGIPTSSPHVARHSEAALPKHNENKPTISFGTPAKTLLQRDPTSKETLEQVTSSDLNTKQVSHLQQPKSPMQAAHVQHDSRHIAQQLAVSFSKQQDGTMVIRLNPEELGQVRMTLKNVDGVMTMTILAERPETTETMRRNIGDLAQEFQSLGYDGLEFSFGDEGTSQRQQPEDDMAEFNVEITTANQPVSEQRTQIVTSSGRLDIRL